MSLKEALLEAVLTGGVATLAHLARAQGRLPRRRALPALLCESLNLEVLPDLLGRLVDGLVRLIIAIQLTFATRDHVVHFLLELLHVLKLGPQQLLRLFMLPEYLGCHLLLPQSWHARDFSEAEHDGRAFRGSGVLRLLLYLLEGGRINWIVEELASRYQRRSRAVSWQAERSSNILQLFATVDDRLRLVQLCLLSSLLLQHEIVEVG